MFEKEIENLEMTPVRWSMLSKVVDEDRYHEIVVDYQKRENELKFSVSPRCRKMFGVCRYWVKGRCGYCGECRNKV